MGNEVEDILTALAEPVRWEWKPDADGGHWTGTSERGSYAVHPGVKRTDFDATPFLYSCRMNLTVHGESSTYFAVIPSADVGKAICVRHAVSGDLTEISTICTATRTASQAFTEKKQAADKALIEPFKQQTTPRLMWHMSNPGAGEWRATGKRGRYIARFDPDRRWVITRTWEGQVVEEQCYLTRAIAVMGCAYHSHTGEWLGTI